jgi:hypothetical protein
VATDFWRARRSYMKSPSLEKMNTTILPESLEVLVRLSVSHEASPC